MSDPREAILAAVRAAIGDATAPTPQAPRTPPAADACDPDALVAQLSERLADYGARVVHAPAHAVAAAVGEVCGSLSLRRIAIPPGLDAAWVPASVECFADRGLDPLELDRLDAALTGCAAAIAQTGTILLDGGARCGRRALTLVPDHHICVIEQAQIAARVPEGLARVEAAVRERRAPITLISGPSATSDIELRRIAGVHGPRNLHAVIAIGGPPRGPL